jgi:hypothetical protein
MVELFVHEHQAADREPDHHPSPEILGAPGEGGADESAKVAGVALPFLSHGDPYTLFERIGGLLRGGPRRDNERGKDGEQEAGCETRTFPDLPLHGLLDDEPRQILREAVISMRPREVPT